MRRLDYLFAGWLLGTLIHLGARTVHDGGDNWRLTGLIIGGAMLGSYLYDIVQGRRQLAATTNHEAGA